MRGSSLSLTVLVVGIFLAKAAFGSENNLAYMPPFEITSDCKADITSWENAVPTTTQYCGPCSPSEFCDGLQVGTPCLVFPGQWGNCKNMFSHMCSLQPLLHECYCSDQPEH